MTLVPLPQEPPADPSKRAQTASDVGVRVRPDLVTVATRHKHESAVVVKDPVALKYHRLRPDEHYLLTRLTGDATLESLRDDYENEYAPRRVSLSEINDLLFRLHRLGLTVSDSPKQGDRLLEKKRQERNRRLLGHLSGVLFIRFPGVDPEPLLKRLYPILRPCLGMSGLMMVVVFSIVAGFTMLANAERFASEFPAMTQWIQWRAVLVLAVVIGVTKVFHELGHAIACKHFGGECHQIGPMLLVFTPALYCDTSDSWTLPNRFARAIVGMAGILTEVILAGVAVLIWAATGPTSVHYVAMNVMLVCSVSTLLFNANPLLRYDGYYVLSDLCDVPNLAQKSRDHLSRWVGRVVFAVTLDESESVGRREKVWLIVYALAAFIYRWSLTILILWFILWMLRPYRLESVGTLLCGFAIAGLLVTTLRSPISFLRHPGKRRLIQMKRVMKSAAVATLFLAVLCWPLPAGESAPGRLVHRKEVPIYVSTPGHLDAIRVDLGTDVSEGQVIAELVNPEVVFQYAKAESRVAVQRELVAALRSSQASLPDAANELPTAETTLAELQRQFESRRSRLDALSIKAAVAGRLIAPPKRGERNDKDALTLVNWTGDPTAASNQGCFVESGAELCTIIADARWDAELVVTSTQAGRIDVGNAVKLVLESDPSRPIAGVVTEISSKQWTVDENGDRRDDENSIQATAPLETSYSVRVQLDSPERPREGMLTGAEVSARIAAKPLSIAGRTMRFLNRLLRFR